MESGNGTGSGNMEDASVGIRSGDWNGTWPTVALEAPINATKCPARFDGYILYSICASVCIID
jgi:hypothetical protein